MIVQKTDPIDLLKEHGYSTYVLRRNKILNPQRIHRMKHGALPSWHELDIICELTGAKVGEIVEHKKNDQI